MYVFIFVLFLFEIHFASHACFRLYIRDVTSSYCVIIFDHVEWCMSYSSVIFDSYGVLFKYVTALLCYS